MKLKIQILSKVTEYIESINDVDRAKIMAHIAVMKSGDFDTVYTKQISGPIRELIIKNCRLLYFNYEDTLYFIGGFTKKSAKTPNQEIKNAKNIYKILKNTKKK